MTATGPDILEVIADLSNDEVFTPPKVANAVLDLLPEDVWTNPDLRWLDPGAKTGVFLREVTKRLLVGLEPAIPDEQERLTHILTKMVFGIAVTELTSLMSRRTVYCSKDASSEHSTVRFPSSSGNIWFERIEHDFRDGRCRECGASATQMNRGNERENYAYAFIHAAGRDAIRKDIEMKFDVIVGNPPYQMDDEGGHRPVPLYNKFVESAIALDPRYLLMITPSRWMAGGLGLTSFRQTMLSDRRMKRIVDYPVAAEIFGGVEIKGGVNYFLWDREHNGKCEVVQKRGDETVGPHERDLAGYDVFVRDSRAIPILEKVIAHQDEPFSDLVASVRPFGDQLRSNFRRFLKERASANDLMLYMNERSQRRQYWVDESFVANNISLSREWKVYLPTAASDGGQRIPDSVVGRAFVGPPNSVCTETYLAIGPFDSEDQAESALSYLRTRFARFLVSLRKPGQHNIPSTFRWVPIQEWDRVWTDEALYEKYRITEDEQAYIAKMVKEMPA